MQSVCDKQQNYDINKINGDQVTQDEEKIGETEKKKNLYAGLLKNNKKSSNGDQFPYLKVKENSEDEGNISVDQRQF